MAGPQRSSRGRADRPRQRRAALPTGVPADDTWQVTRAQMTTEVEDDSGAPRRPWLTLIVGEQTGLALATDIRFKRPTAADVLKVIGQTIKKPMIGRPRRPQRVVCAEQDLAESLAPGLAALGIECSTGATPQLAEVLAELTGALDARRPVPGLLDTPGVTPELVGRLFGAAAAFYRRAPWQVAPDNTPIAVRVPAVSDQTTYVVVIGQAGVAKGLAFYRTPEALQVGLSVTDPEEAIALADQEGLTFDTAEETPEADLDAVVKHGWEVAGPDAYPVPLIISRSGQFLRPSATDIEWYETVLWTLPYFVEGHLAQAYQTGNAVDVEVRVTTDDRELVAAYRYPPAIGRRMGRRKRP